MVNCCVCGVERGSSQDFNLTFHKFPKNEDLRLKWWEAIGKVTSYSASVCSKHFKTEDYKNHEDLNLVRKILKPSAVPDKYNKFSKNLKSIEDSPPSDAIDLSIEKNRSIESLDHINLKYKNNGIQNESCDDRLQVNRPSTSTSINNSINKSNNDTILCSTAIQIKDKKIGNHNTLQVSKRRCQDAILGTMRREDFTNEDVWLRFQRYVHETRKQYKLLLLKNSRLRLKIGNFQNRLKIFKKKQLLSNNISRHARSRLVLLNKRVMFYTKK